MSKEATVYVIDASPSMIESGNFKKAIHIVSKLLTRKIWGSRKGDQVGVLVIGSTTCNRVNEEQGDYDHVYDVGFDLDQDDVILKVPTAKLLQRLEDLEPTEQGDFMDGIIVGIHMLHQHCISAKTGKPLKYTKKMYLFTDAQTEMHGDFLDDMLDKCRNNQVQTMVCAFDFESPVDIEIKHDPVNERQQREHVLKQFVLCTEDGVLVDSNDALDMVEQLQAKAVNPTTTFRGNLTLGDPASQGSFALSIPVWLYNKTVQLKPPSAKKYSKLSDDHEVGMDRLFFKETDDGELDDYSGETIRAYKYGKYLIPITAEDEQEMALAAPKQIEIIQFVRLADIKREWYMGSIFVVIPSPESKLAHLQFDTMMSTMFEEDVGAIVRYTRTENGAPKICLLKVQDSTCFLIQLPFASDARPLPKTNNVIVPTTKKEKSLASYCIDEGVDDKMDMFIDSMMLDDFEVEDMHNTTYHYMVKCIAHRAMRPSDPLPDDQEFTSLWQSKTSVYSEELKNCFRFGEDVSTSQMEIVPETVELPPTATGMVITEVPTEKVVDVFDLLFD